jgi:hypothetical protein
MQYLQLQHQTIMTFPAYRTGTDTRMQVPFPGVTQQYHPVGAALQIELDFLLALARDGHPVAHRRREPVAPHGVSGRIVKDPMRL